MPNDEKFRVEVHQDGDQSVADKDVVVDRKGGSDHADRALRSNNSEVSVGENGDKGDDTAVSEDDDKKVAFFGSGAIAYTENKEWVYVDGDFEKFGRF